jgi:hypothetical protein
MAGIVYIVGNASTPVTPVPDYRGVFFKTAQVSNAQPVYKVEEQAIYLWYSGTAWYINAVVGSTGIAGFTSATILGDKVATGGATGAVGVTDGEDYRIFLKESDSTMITIGEAGIPRTKELVRRWNKLKDNYARLCTDLLNTWTSAENWSARFYVDNPRAVGPSGWETWPGRWRLVNVTRMKDEPDGIMETLRLGFQQHSGTTGDPLDQSEARLGKGTGNVVTGDRVYREDWRYTDPAYHSQIMVDLKAIKTVTNPTIEGVVLTGLFACSNIIAQPNDDGSIFISRTLTEIHSITALINLTALAPVVTQEQELINLFGFQVGNEEKLLYIYNNINPTSRTYCAETLSAANLESIPGGAWKLYDRKFVIDENSGAASFAILFMKEGWTGTYAQRNLVKGGTLSGWLRDIALQATGETLAQAQADFDLILDEVGAAYDTGTNYTKGDCVTYSSVKYICITPTTGTWDPTKWITAHYLLNGRQIQERGRGEFVVTSDMVSAYDGYADTDAITVSAGVAFTVEDRKVGVRVWFRRSKEAKDALLQIAPTLGEAHKPWTYNGQTFASHNWVMEDHQNGTYTIRQYGWVMIDVADLGAGYISRIKPGITVEDQKMIMRYWPMLTLAAKDKLTAGALPGPLGDARKDYTFETQIYTHADCFIEDNGENGYTVRQVLVYLETGYASTDALVIQIKPSITEYGQKVLVRVWATRSAAATALLTAPAGAARSNYTWPDDGVTYTHAECYIDDRGRAGYTVRQVLVSLSGDTTTTTALIFRIKDASGTQEGVVQRVWMHRTTAAKNTLTTLPAGVARLGDTIETKVYTHIDFQVTDLGNGGYNVTQTLAYLGAGYVAGDKIWDDTFEFYKTFTRSKDDKIKTIHYTRYIFVRSTEQSAWDEFDTVVNKVSGSESVVRTGRYSHRATCVSLISISKWT